MKKKKFKKALAVACAGAVCAVSVPLGGLTVGATDEPPYTAWLCISAGSESTWDATGCRTGFCFD